MSSRTDLGERRAWAALARVQDPELPFLSVLDLGVVRSVTVEGDRVEVAITPTYSGCPAMEVIEEDVAARLVEAGFTAPAVLRQLSPAWTTDWITEEGRAALAAHGIAPPGPVQASEALVPIRVPRPCPRCGSRRTEELSRFGSTACKALHRCLACDEPFDAVKAL